MRIARLPHKLSFRFLGTLDSPVRIPLAPAAAWLCVVRVAARGIVAVFGTAKGAGPTVEVVRVVRRRVATGIIPERSRVCRVFSDSPPRHGFSFGAGLLRMNSPPSLSSVKRRRIAFLSFRLAA